METSASSASAAQRPSLLPTGLVLLAFLVVAVVFCSTADWYLTFKALHVSFAVIWIGGGFMLTILGIIAEREQDEEQIVVVVRQASFVGERIFTPASLIVLLAGIAMMINVDWGWDHFWVTFGLLGFLATFVTGIAVLSPRAKKVKALVATAGPAAPETQAAIRELLLIARIDLAVLLLVIVDMVVKPFS